MILQANPKASYLAYQTEIDEAIARVLQSGWYILGKEVHTFEEEFALFCESKFSVGVSDGTNALVLSLKALGIGAGDEVITTGHTAVATLVAIELVGATAVLVDVEPDYYTLSPEAVAEAITPHTKAIIAVHIYGQPADLDTLQALANQHGLHLIEDCAQAHGARYHGKRVGSMGIIGSFSFYPTKNLGAFGDGGGIVTQDETLYHHLQALRQYGWEHRYISSIQGYNSRLDELHAAMLRVKLGYLEADNAKRRALAAIYDEILGRSSKIGLPAVRPNCEHVYHLYVVQVDNREEVMNQLKERGIGTAIHYPQPNHSQPAYDGRVRTVPAGLPNLVAMTPRILSLPLYPELTEAEVQKVAENLLEVVG